MNMHLTHEQRTIATQRAKIEELEEQIRQMRAAASVSVPPFPKHWNLTPTHHRMLAAFAKSPDGFVGHEQLFIATASRSDDPNLLKVQITKLRKAVQYLGIKIVNRWGYGYEVTAESHAFIKAAMNGEVE